MERADVGKKLPHVLARAVAAAGGFGVGLIIGGLALAVYSSWFADTASLSGLEISGEDVFGAYSWLAIADLPERTARAGVIAGALMLAVAVAIVIRGLRSRSGPAWWLVLAALAIGGAFTTFVSKNHLPGAYQRVRFEYPLFAQLPTGVAAGALIAIGTVLLIVLALRPADLQHLGRWMLVVPIVVGLVASAGVALVAVRAGDDQANIDHTTAPVVEIAPIPQRLGSEEYRMSMPIKADLRDTPWSTYTFGDPDIVSAGAGFVVATTAGLTAYDGSTGEPRWQYHRKNVYKDVTDGERYGVEYLYGSLISADGGAVVLARWDNFGTIAFDAITGGVLWTTSDYTRTLATTSDLPTTPGWDRVNAGPLDFRPTPQFLLLTNYTNLARFDAQTGNRMWTAQICTAGWVDGSKIAVTEHSIYLLKRCVHDDETTLTVIALDPKTGTELAARELYRTSGEPNKAPSTGMSPPQTIDPPRRFANTVRFSWRVPGTDEYLTIHVDRPDRLETAPALADAPRTESADPHSPDIYTSRPSQVRTTDNIGTVRFEIPIAERRIMTDTVFIESELVQIGTQPADRGEYVTDIRTWDRTNGAPHDTVVVGQGEDTCADQGILPVPGAILVACYRNDRIDLIGYRPTA